MCTTKQRKIIILVLGVFSFLLGCSRTPEVERLPTLGITATKLPESNEPIEKKTLSAVTPTPSQEKSECSSIKVETELPNLNTPENYRGKVFDTLALPSGLEFVSGSLIGDSDFALDRVMILETNTQVLWLSEIKCRTAYIHDVLVLPVVKEDEELVIRYCRVDGQEDPEVLAIGKFTSGIIPLTTIEYAWRANQEGRTFEVLSSGGIKCWRDIGINSP